MQLGMQLNKALSTLLMRGRIAVFERDWVGKCAIVAMQMLTILDKESVRTRVVLRDHEGF